MYAPNMAARVHISVVILIFLVLNDIFLSGKYHGSLRISKYFILSSCHHQKEIISSARSDSPDMCLAETWRDLLISHKDITIAMDIETQPGPSTIHSPKSTGLRSLQ